MAVPKKRTGKSAQATRRANWKATKPEVTTCPNCGAFVLAHTVCTACGFYKGKPVSLKDADKAVEKKAPKKSTKKVEEAVVEETKVEVAETSEEKPAKTTKKATTKKTTTKTTAAKKTTAKKTTTKKTTKKDEKAE